MSTNFSERNQQILSDIQNLQTIEQGLFSNLENNNSTMSQEEQQQIIQKMNQISQMRINLYKSLTGINTYFQDALVNSRDTLDEQIVAIGIVEEQLNDAKKRLALIEEQKNSNIRNIEINDYYSEKYSNHTSLMKIVIFMLVPIIILAVLYNKGFIPTPIYLTLIAIIALVGFYFLFNGFYSMMRRDPMNYQQYQWDFNPNDVPNSSSNGPSVDPWAGGVSTVCVGAQCCNQYETFDANLNKCIAITNSSTNSNSTSGTDLNASVNVNSYLSSLAQNDYNSLSNSVSNAYSNISSGLVNDFSGF